MIIAPAINIEEINADENSVKICDCQCVHLDSELYKGERWRAIREDGYSALDICDACNDTVTDIVFILKSAEDILRRFYAQLEGRR